MRRGDEKRFSTYPQVFHIVLHFSTGFSTKFLWKTPMRFPLLPPKPPIFLLPTNKLILILVLVLVLASIRIASVCECMLSMFAICSSSRIFSRRALSSGLRFFLAICISSCVALLFYTPQEVYTNLGMFSFFPGNKKALLSERFTIGLSPILPFSTVVSISYGTDAGKRTN